MHKIKKNLKCHKTDCIFITLLKTTWVNLRSYCCKITFSFIRCLTLCIQLSTKMIVMNIIFDLFYGPKGLNIIIPKTFAWLHFFKRIFVWVLKYIDVSVVYKWIKLCLFRIHAFTVVNMHKCSYSLHFKFRSVVFSEFGEES